jgi:hypothetical protein
VVISDETVSSIASNSTANAPNGIFGICFDKSSDTLCRVLFIGRLGGYSGLTVGSALFLQTDGSVGHTVPTTGMVQQIGFAVSSTDAIFNLLQPMRRN